MKKTAIALTLSMLMLVATGTQFTDISSANFFPDPGPDLPRIYIRTDGSIEPQTAPIERSGSLYRLTGNIILQTIEIQGDDIILDGSNYLIQGNASWIGIAPRSKDAGNNGIIIADRSNVTITRLNIERFTTGIRISNSSRITIVDNLFKNETATFDTHVGITVTDSSLVLIENNNFKNIYGTAIFCQGKNNIIKRNSVSSAAASVDGSIHLEGSSNTVSDNEIESVFPIVLDRADSNTVEKNNITGPQNQSYGGREGIALYSQCSNNMIFGNNITGFSGQAVRTVFSCSNNTFYGNYMANNEFAIILQEGATNNKFYGNTFAADSCNVSVYDAESNFWDNGSIGNYWGDYNGVDINSDGVGDSPYVLNGFRWDTDVGGFVTVPSGQDNFPLMTPYDIEQNTVVLSTAMPFADLLIAVASVAVALGAVLLVYFKKRKH
jgi:parallel beta-helix repeat protein